MAKITLENWKEYKASEAQSLFHPEQIVVYDIGFTRYSEYVGKVNKITSAGVIYVNPIKLKLVSHNKVKHPSDWQSGGWSKYNPKKIIKIEEELLRFMPTFEDSYQTYIFHDPEHPLIWKGKEWSGLWHLRPIETDKKGLIKLSYDPID